jgi:hypothetical protein
MKYAVLQKHILNCPECSKAAAGVEEARSTTFSRQSVLPVNDPWPAVSRRLAGESTKDRAPRRLSWRWAAGLVSAAALIWFLSSFFPRPQPEMPVALDVDLRIEKVTLYDQPAQAFIFKTQDPDRTFVWIEKSEGDNP